MKKLIFNLKFILFLTFPFLSFSATPTLELQYPGSTWTTGVFPQIPEYVSYLFKFVIGISGFILLGIITYGGFLWLTSAGNPSLINEAKRKILYGFLGISLLLGSVLILNTIQGTIKRTLPELEKVFVPFRPGIIVCKGTIPDLTSFLERYLTDTRIEKRVEAKTNLEKTFKNKKCISLESGNLESKLKKNESYTFIHLPKMDFEISGTGTVSSSVEYIYGVVGYSKENQKGKCTLISQSGDSIYTRENLVKTVTPIFDIRSVKIFQKQSILISPSESGVTIYDCYNLGNNPPKDCPLREYATPTEPFPHFKTFTPTGDLLKIEKGEDTIVASGTVDKFPYSYTTTIPLWKHAYSLRISPEGVYTVLLFSKESFEGECVTILGSQGDLTWMGDEFKKIPLIGVPEVQIKSMMIIKGQ
jgi:hypothetical protein